MVILKQVYEEDGSQCFLLKDDDETVGQCEIFPEDFYVHSVEIKEEYRNQGYGKQMISMLIQHFAGCPLWLEAWKENIPAIKTYTACGFCITKEDYLSHYNLTKCRMELSAYVKESR